MPTTVHHSTCGSRTFDDADAAAAFADQLGRQFPQHAAPTVKSTKAPSSPSSAKPAAKRKAKK